MKKIILGIIAFSIFGCSSDDSSVSDDNKPNTLRLKSISSSSEFNYEIHSFYYNDNKLAYTEGKEKYRNGEEETYKEEYIYENNKLVRIKQYENNVYLSNDDNYYQYTGENITTSSGHEDNILFSHQFEYNNLNQMTKESQYSDGDFDADDTYTYYQDGNIEKKTYGSSSSNPVTITYTYDNKRNPEYYAYPEELSKIYTISKNNELTKNSNITYEYEYNSNDLPIKKITKENGNIYKTEIYEYY